MARHDPIRQAPGRRPAEAADGPPAARREPAPASAPARRPARSELQRLLAEVEKLAGELAAARAKVSELEAAAEVDPLTAVLNRRGFERELRRTLSYVNRYRNTAALIYLDLDRFKPVNDTHGHAAGDAVLKAVAAMLLRKVRGSDAVARLGGDEFAVILWNIPGPQAEAKAAALEVDVAAAAVDVGGAVVSVGASAGVALIGPEDTLADVLARADAAMYARKRTAHKSARGGSRR